MNIIAWIWLIIASARTTEQFCETFTEKTIVERASSFIACIIHLSLVYFFICYLF